MTDNQANNDPQSEFRNPLSEGAPSAIRSLRRFMRPRAVVERCEMCSAELTGDHPHLVEPSSRQIVCACDACSVLFSGRAGTKYLRVPRHVISLPDFQLTDAQWDALFIPIGLAFFFHSSPAGKTIALYPSPAGATESLLALDAWDEIVRDNLRLKELEPDTEALLVNRINGAGEYYVVPIDECYKLVGLIRMHWRGFSGGAEVWEEIGKFFAGLQERARPSKEAARA